MPKRKRLTASQKAQIVLEAIRAKYEPLIKSDRNSERMGAALDFLFARPILSAKQLAESVGMPFKTARHYIEKLAKAGILREVTGNACNQIYRADEVFGAVDNLQE
ncbi:MAG: winged helix-turn-helix transcriptional regulator [Minisyncoccota bacterium]